MHDWELLLAYGTDFIPVWSPESDSNVCSLRFSEALLFEECNVMLSRAVKDLLLMSLSFSKPVLILILEDIMASHFTFIRKHHLTLSSSVSYMTVTYQICDVFISLLPKETILHEQAKTKRKLLKLTAWEGVVLFISFCSCVWFRYSVLYF